MDPSCALCGRSVSAKVTFPENRPFLWDRVPVPGKDGLKIQNRPLAWATPLSASDRPFSAGTVSKPLFKLLHRVGRQDRLKKLAQKRLGFAGQCKPSGNPHARAPSCSAGVLLADTRVRPQDHIARRPATALGPTRQQIESEPAIFECDLSHPPKTARSLSFNVFA
jgi:hypothetical protein